jgi:cyclophilin family peptidyl-prolyl cis-trans isomerase
VLAQLELDFPDDLRVVYRQFPLVSLHDKALLATQATEAAGLQDAFWKMHDFLFVNYNSWVNLSVDEFQAWLIEHVADLGIDVDKFANDLISDAIVAKAQSFWETGKNIISGTPFLAINGYPYFGGIAGQNFEGDINYYSLYRIIALEAVKDQQYTFCPPMAIDPLKRYVATIQTDKGNIVVELFPDVAPLAVNSFIFLAENGWYDGVTFHRVLPGFVAQAGDPTGTGWAGPGYAFRNEISSELVFDRKGLIAMANSGTDTNGSQFFITYAPEPDLNGGYTIFGQVIAGMDVAESLTPRDPSQNFGLPPGDRIVTITIDEQ